MPEIVVVIVAVLLVMVMIVMVMLQQPRGMEQTKNHALHSSLFLYTYYSVKCTTCEVHYSLLKTDYKM